MRQVSWNRNDIQRMRGTMTTSGIVTFVLVAGAVWGGLVLILTTAIRKESRKGGQE